MNAKLRSNRIGSKIYRTKEHREFSGFSVVSWRCDGESIDIGFTIDDRTYQAQLPRKYTEVLLRELQSFLASTPEEKCKK